MISAQPLPVQISVSTSPELQSVTQNDAVAAGLVLPARFTAAECARLRGISRARAQVAAGVYPPPPTAIRRASTWEIDLAREDEFSWLSQKLHDIAQRANQRFNFELANRIEPAWCVRYAEGDYLDWHIDLGSGAESTRKIAMSIQLSDPADYEGGSLHLLPMPHPIENLPMGSVIAFPAYVAHRVTPVIRGERWALIAWIHGPAFR